MKTTHHIAHEISKIVPTFMRHMFPYVFEPIDVPPSQVLAITALEEKKSLTLGALRRELHVSAPTVTGIVDRLQKAGYIKRFPDPKDRRVTHILLTKKGEAVAKEFRRNIQKRWGYILSKLPAEIQEGPLNLLKRITQGFSDGTI